MTGAETEGYSHGRTVGYGLTTVPYGAEEQPELTVSAMPVTWRRSMIGEKKFDVPAQGSWRLLGDALPERI